MDLRYSFWCTETWLADCTLYRFCILTRLTEQDSCSTLASTQNLQGRIDVSEHSKPSSSS